jgi:hypothetical protein
MRNPIHNSNVVFRCPSNLKDRMRAFAEDNGERLSAFIRSACMEVLKREAPTIPQLKENA